MSKTLLPIEKVRIACYKKGANGLVGLFRKFRLIDFDRCKQLDYHEFRRGLLGTTIIKNGMIFIVL